MRRFNLRWLTVGDIDLNLSEKELLGILTENGCVWVYDHLVLNSSGHRVAVITSFNDE